MQTGTDVPPQREIIGCTDALGRRGAAKAVGNLARVALLGIASPLSSERSNVLVGAAM